MREKDITMYQLVERYLIAACIVVIVGGLMWVFFLGIIFLLINAEWMLFVIAFLIATWRVAIRLK